MKIIKNKSIQSSSLFENTFLQNVNGKPLYFLLSDKVFLYWLTTFFLTLNLEEGDKLSAPLLVLKLELFLQATAAQPTILEI